MWENLTARTLGISFLIVECQWLLSIGSSLVVAKQRKRPTPGLPGLRSSVRVLYYGNLQIPMELSTWENVKVSQ